MIGSGRRPSAPNAKVSGKSLYFNTLLAKQIARLARATGYRVELTFAEGLLRVTPKEDGLMLIEHRGQIKVSAARLNLPEGATYYPIRTVEKNLYLECAL